MYLGIRVTVFKGRIHLSPDPNHVSSCGPKDTEYSDVRYDLVGFSRG